MFYVPDPLPDHLTVVRQTDPGGHDPTSSYVEWYWLPIVGPSAFVVYRRLNELLGTQDSIVLRTEAFGALFGLRMPLLTKALTRLTMFGLGYFPMQADSTFSIRPTLPDLPSRHVERFSPELRARFSLESQLLREARAVGVGALVADDRVGGLEGAVAEITARRDALVDDGRLERHISY